MIEKLSKYADSSSSSSGSSSAETGLLTSRRPRKRSKPSLNSLEASRAVSVQTPPDTPLSSLSNSSPNLLPADGPHRETPPVHHNSKTLHANSEPARRLRPRKPQPVRSGACRASRVSQSSHSSLAAPATPKPCSSIPVRKRRARYAAQSIAAAVSSRLPPFALHRDELAVFGRWLGPGHVTTYINIRNGILRFWLRNPRLPVTETEALGCARSQQLFPLAAAAYEWLSRHGYINSGCLQSPALQSPSLSLSLPLLLTPPHSETVVVVGGGVAGLSCARQLSHLFREYAVRFASGVPPRIIILEARQRFGGRVCSAALESGKGGFVDLGAQVITGFGNGNPLAVLKRQLGLRCEQLSDDTVIYDEVTGRPVDSAADKRVEALFNYALDTLAEWREAQGVAEVVEAAECGGDEESIRAGRDFSGIDVWPVMMQKVSQESFVSQKEPTGRPGPPGITTTQRKLRRKTVAQRTPRGSPGVQNSPQNGVTQSPFVPELNLGELAQLGFKLRPEYRKPRMETSSGSDTNNCTLGACLRELLRQYTLALHLSRMEVRLFHWHVANVEYADAARAERLSLAAWAQDDGYEFSGTHSFVYGGFSQFAQGLSQTEPQLDLRLGHVVSTIETGMRMGAPCRVHLADGGQLEAQRVVCAVPLGVLKSGGVRFAPPLPARKAEAVERLGFGPMNKVVLVFDGPPFWDPRQTFLGVARQTEENTAEAHQEARGRLFMFWNCTRTSGRSALVGLLSGAAAEAAAGISDDELVAEAVAVLQRLHPRVHVPQPVESFVTRWQSDEFSRGSYCYLAESSSGKDYEVMAKPVGDVLFFAGDATSREYPATVPGAYLSGLRAAGEVLDSFIGRQKCPAGVFNVRNGVNSAADEELDENYLEGSDLEGNDLDGGGRRLAQ